MHNARVKKHGDPGPAEPTKAAPGQAVWGEVEYRRRAQRLKRYGVTPEQFDQMLTDQDGRCAICRTSSPSRGTRVQTWCVDHHHETGAVRGLLCDACNRGIGLLGDAPAVLLAAANYLQRHLDSTGGQHAATHP